MTEFILNENLISTSCPPSMTLLDYLRYEANLRGTKIGCREGDCGACTVLIGKLNAGEINYESVTSCLTPLGNVHGRHVVTVEGLNIQDLNRVQKAMVDCSGTQCGICTPGFVVSLCAYVLQADDKLYKSAKDAVDGNICRCTGYKSIERAAERIDSELLELTPHRKLSDLIKNGFIPTYFKDIADRLKQIPKLKLERGIGKVVGGGTDLYVQKHDELQSIQVYFQSAESDEVGVRVENGHCFISSSGTATDLMKCEALNDSIPNWYKYMKLVSSVPIRNIGTIAGNLVNASPIGDFSIILLALNAELELESLDREKRKVFLRDFFLDYKKIQMKRDEIVRNIIFPLPNDKDFHFEKVCKRKFLDISTVNTAIGIEKRDQFIVDAHASVGGVSAIPLYLSRTSAFLRGKELTYRTISEAETILQSEIQPISDARGSASYKRLLASQLFKSHFLHLYPSLFKMEQML